MKDTHIIGAVESYIRTKESPLDPEQVEEVKNSAIERYSSSWDNFQEAEWGPSRTPTTPYNCTKCYLQNWFKWNRYNAEPMTAQTRLNFRLGHIIEAEVYTWAKMSGLNVYDYQKKAEIVIGGLPCTAYFDFFVKSPLDGRRRVVDVKTMSSFAFDRLKLGDWPT